MESYEVVPVGRAKNITGATFGRLTAVFRVKHSVRPHWLCECVCGNEKVISARNLQSGLTRSCGCLTKESTRVNGLKNKKDIKGLKFNRLTVLSDTGKRSHSHIVWECICECGGVAHVTANALIKGNTKSCGCLTDEKRRMNSKKRIVNRIGETVGRLTVLKRIGVEGKETFWECSCKCGKLTTVSNSNIASKKTRSCGCLFKEMVGDNHPNYNPHLSDHERGKRRTEINGKSVKKWREKVFQRDDFTCQVCRKRGGKLNAHHLDGWNWCKDKRYTPDNGITLCFECHSRFHKKYGKGHNTRNQFEEWINQKEFFI